jgi:hypothetical protein
MLMALSLILCSGLTHPVPYPWTIVLASPSASLVEHRYAFCALCLRSVSLFLIFSTHYRLACFRSLASPR